MSTQTQDQSTMKLVFTPTPLSSHTSYPDLSEASLAQRSPAPPRISLLELIKSRAGDNSAESTAQQLLQHMAERLTGNPTGGLNMSQTVQWKGRGVGAWKGDRITRLGRRKAFTYMYMYMYTHL